MQVSQSFWTLDLYSITLTFIYFEKIDNHMIHYYLGCLDNEILSLNYSEDKGLAGAYLLSNCMLRQYRRVSLVLYGAIHKLLTLIVRWFHEMPTFLNKSNYERLSFRAGESQKRPKKSQRSLLTTPNHWQIMQLNFEKNTRITHDQMTYLIERKIYVHYHNIVCVLSFLKLLYRFLLWYKAKLKVAL